MKIAAVRKRKRAMRTRVNIRNFKFKLGVFRLGIAGLGKPRAAKKGEEGHTRKRAHHHGNLS
jgi:hypothetical protein